MFVDMCKVLENGESGDFRLEKFTITDKNFRALIDGTPPGEYIRLLHNRECVMSNTPMEERTNSEFVDKAYGDVLIGGLGIGMIVLAIQDNPKVRTITVLEKYADVINLVGNHLPLNDKVKIIHADVYEYEPTDKYDTIYMDIWNYVNEDIYYNKMCPLIEKYNKCLKSKKENPNHFIKCWAQYEAKNGLKLS